MQLIDVLHDNGTINDEAYAKLRAAAAADKSQSSGSTVQETEAPPESSKQQHKAARVEFEGSKVRIQSADKQYRFRLGGRLMADAALYNEDINALGNGSEMRRLRLSWDATLSRNWYLKSSVELAGGLSLKSTYIDYIGFPGTYIRFGNDKEPVTMEDLGSSKYTTFMERAMLTTGGSPAACSRAMMKVTNRTRASVSPAASSTHPGTAALPPCTWACRAPIAGQAGRTRFASGHVPNPISQTCTWSIRARWTTSTISPGWGWNPLWCRIPCPCRPST
jgi:hypothetical protein